MSAGERHQMQKQCRGEHGTLEAAFPQRNSEVVNWSDDVSDVKHSSFSKRRTDVFCGSGQIETSRYEVRTSLFFLIGE